MFIYFLFIYMFQHVRCGNNGTWMPVIINTRIEVQIQTHYWISHDTLLFRYVSFNGYFLLRI